MKLSLTVHVCMGKLYHLLEDAPMVNGVINLVHSALKRHYQARLDALQSETLSKQTFSKGKMTMQQVLQPAISLHRSMQPPGESAEAH